MLLSAAAVLLLRVAGGSDSVNSLPEDEIPKRYSPEALAEYFSTKKAVVWRRSVFVVAEISQFVVAFYLDKWTGKLEVCGVLV